MSSIEGSIAVVGYHDGSAGQVESWFEAATGLKIACFVIDSAEFSEIDVEEENRKRVCKTTDFPQLGRLKGRPVIVARNWIEEVSSIGVKRVICLEPDNLLRLKQIELVRNSGLRLVSAIHPSALILPGAQIEDGVWINAGCTIGYKAEVRAGAIMNTGVQIDHHNVLQQCCQLDPGVVTAGNVVLGECCYVHTGAVLINRVQIGAGAIVGAGAVVTKSVPPNCTVVGIPARIIKSPDASSD